MERCLKIGIFLLSLLCSIPLYASTLHYAIIIDAGSSGSRLHLFEYREAEGALPIIQDIFNQRINPGLSAYALTPANAGESLKPLLDACSTALRKKAINPAHVPIYIYGTAGMRLLSEYQQAAIYNNVQQYIQDNYAFSMQNGNIKTVSGFMEGIYGWLDINYLLKNFTTFAPTVGSIDMGGASTQIAFETLDTDHPQNELVLYLNQKPYRIFSQSFLRLGQDEAGRTLTLLDPYRDSASSCYPTNYPLLPAAGEFDFLRCTTLYSSLLQQNNIEAQVIPTENQSFVAFSGIYYNYNFFNILQTPTQSALEAKINATCYLPWSELQYDYPSEPIASLSHYCANASYFDALLYHTYQLQGSQLQVTNTLNNIDIDWTLGALLYQLSQ